MAIVRAVKTGNWSDTTVWNTGALPTSSDDVYSNAFTVTIDTSPTVLSLSNAATTGVNAGGTFTLVNGSNLTCTNTLVPLQGQAIVTFSTASPGSATVNANFSSSTGIGALNSSTGTLTVNGNATRTSGNNFLIHLIKNTSSGTLNLNGNITGDNGNSQYTVTNEASGIVNITGNISGTAGIAVNNMSGGTININGTSITGGGSINSSAGTVNITASTLTGATLPAIINTSTGTINITGSAIAGTASAFVNNSTGTITHIGTAQASATAPAIGAGVVGQTTILTGPLLSTDASYAGGATASGVNPCIALRWFPKDTALSTFNYRMKAQTVVGIRSDRDLYLPEAYSSSYPLTSNVRRSTTYGPTGIYTGTCYIPDPQTVGYGVGVGSTTGTAVFFTIDSLWGVPISSLTVPGSIGERLKNAATTSSVAQVLKDAYR